MRDLIRAGGICPDDALRITHEVCDALQYAHGAGIVTATCKPSNILLDTDGRAKVCDFGIAKVFGGESGDHTQTGGGLGTPGYVAPEVLEESGVVDARADVYSVGVLLYELLTGGSHMGLGCRHPSGRVSASGSIRSLIAPCKPSRRRGYQRVEDVRTDLSVALQPAEPVPRQRSHGKASVRGRRTGRAWRFGLVVGRALPQ